MLRFILKDFHSSKCCDELDDFFVIFDVLPPTVPYQVGECSVMGLKLVGMSATDITIS